MINLGVFGSVLVNNGIADTRAAQIVVYADSRHQAVEKAQNGLGRTVDKAVDLIKGTAEPYNEQFSYLNLLKFFTDHAFITV